MGTLSWPSVRAMVLLVFLFALVVSALPFKDEVSSALDIESPDSILAGIARDTNVVPTIAGNSLTLLFQNDLNVSTIDTHGSGLLTGPTSLANAPVACAGLNETPMPMSQIEANEADFLAQFNYLCYAGLLICPTGVWVNEGVIMVEAYMQSFSLLPASQFSSASLPTLCTQSDNAGFDSNSAPSATNQIIVQGNHGNTYQGYHNKKAFRFFGIPYTNSPSRFEYSSANSATNTAFQALQYGPECLQIGTTTASEDCLFLNVHTPYLPGTGTDTKLRPVLFFIHGGAFMYGNGAAGLNGDNMASRENVVMVSFNYRLNTYGFMAIPGSAVTGNYAVSDMVSALDWVVANIARFGGDPTQITIVGQSAGAAGVRILFGSAQAIGKYQRAIVMSNLGGAVDLGSAGDIGTTNSQYYTIEQSYNHAGNGVLIDANCSQSTVAEQVDCLKAYTGNLASLGVTSSFPVQDGHFINTPYLEVGMKGSTLANVPLMMGNLNNDGASFTVYSTSCKSVVDCVAENLNIHVSGAQAVIDSGLFPYENTGNLQADSFRLAQLVRTDDTFRCIDQATAYAATTTGSTGPVYYYQFTRTFGGFNPNGPGLVDAYGPATDGFAHDPNLPYYRLHAGELAFVLGNQATFRDPDDYVFMQVTVAYWGSFVRTGNPNPDDALLEARSYIAVLNAVKSSGGWPPVAGGSGPIMELNSPSVVQTAFNDVLQCNWLNYTLDYFL